MSDDRLIRPKNPEDDWKIWLVLNPANWLVPIWIAVLLVALAIHAYVLPSANYAWFSAPVESAQAK